MIKETLDTYIVPKENVNEQLLDQLASLVLAFADRALSTIHRNQVQSVSLEER